MSNKNNDYEYYDSSISVSLLNTNLLLSEFSVLRCPSCKLIPSIKLNSIENTLEYLCPNNHKEKGKFEDIYKKLKLNNLNNLICFKINYPLVLIIYLVCSLISSFIKVLI